MPSCVMRHCSNYTGRSNNVNSKTFKSVGITYHAFPKDKSLKREWVVIVRKQRKEPDFKPSNYSRVCSAHFKTEDILTTIKGLTKIRRGAIPYIKAPPLFKMTVNNTIAHQRLILSGDRERFKELLRRRLIECGWRDQVRMLCRDVVKESEGNNVTLDTLVTRVTPRARALVPDTVKKELLQKIKTHLLTQKDQ